MQGQSRQVAELQEQLRAARAEAEQAEQVGAGTLRALAGGELLGEGSRGNPSAPHHPAHPVKGWAAMWRDCWKGGGLKVEGCWQRGREGISPFL